MATGINQEVKTQSQDRVPALEAWLHQNTVALKSVLQGLREASQNIFSDTQPDVDADLEWLDGKH